MSAANDIRGWADDVRRFAADWPADAITVVDDAITQRLRADTGDGSLSHGRGMGRATTRITRRKGEAVVETDGSMRVWGIIEGGTSAHIVDAGAGRALRTPHGFRRRVRVSGTRPRHTFTVGAEKGLSEAAKDAEAQWARIGA